MIGAAKIQVRTKGVECLAVILAICRFDTALSVRTGIQRIKRLSNFVHSFGQSEECCRIVLLLQVELLVSLCIQSLYGIKPSGINLGILTIGGILLEQIDHHLLSFVEVLTAFYNRARVTNLLLLGNRGRNRQQNCTYATNNSSRHIYSFLMKKRHTAIDGSVACKFI